MDEPQNGGAAQPATDEPPGPINVAGSSPEIVSDHTTDDLKIVMGEFDGPLDLLLHLIRQEVPDLQFRVIGDGEERAMAAAFVAKNGLSGAVTFLGMKPHEKVVEELSKCHVLIHPSTTAANGDSEGGAPTILLEAQAVGTPIVTTRHADIPHVTTPRGGVFLVPEKDPAALARATGTASSSAIRSRHDGVAYV